MNVKKLLKLKNALRLITTRILNRKLISKISIEITSACNCRCIWCQMQNFHKHKIGFMKLEEFEQIIRRNASYLKKNNIWVEPYFRGEPLLHPQFFEILDVLKYYHIGNGGINTNLSVKVDISRFRDYEMGILVNIGGTTKEVHEKVMVNSDFDLVVANLKKMFDLGIPVQVKMNPTKMNIHQLKELPRFLQNLGGNENNIVPYTTCYPIPAVATSEEIDIFFDNVVSRDVDPYLRFSYDLSKPNKAIKTKNPGCNFLQDMIFFDGQFSICCHDQLALINVGNVFRMSIEQIHKSEKYHNALKIAKRCGFSFCKECN